LQKAINCAAQTQVPIRCDVADHFECAQGHASCQASCRGRSVSIHVCSI
jgi:hypothetical protein